MRGQCEPLFFFFFSSKLFAFLVHIVTRYKVAPIQMRPFCTTLVLSGPQSGEFHEWGISVTWISNGTRRADGDAAVQSFN